MPILYLSYMVNTFRGSGRESVEGRIHTERARSDLIEPRRFKFRVLSFPFTPPNSANKLLEVPKIAKIKATIMNVASEFWQSAVLASVDWFSLGLLAVRPIAVTPTPYRKDSPKTQQVLGTRDDPAKVLDNTRKEYMTKTRDSVRTDLMKKDPPFRSQRVYAVSRDTLTLMIREEPLEECLILDEHELWKGILQDAFSRRSEKLYGSMVELMKKAGSGLSGLFS
ncbi:hypothetical protein IW262DRAFT_1300792 [Armillaria fumosa]|nr:hypothetical protein IW262DRAFT_1300792 [Armillaria fumosa]